MSTLELPDFRLPVVAEITLARSASELYKKKIVSTGLKFLVHAPMP
jgi:hypothetical protein